MQARSPQGEGAALSPPLFLWRYGDAPLGRCVGAVEQIEQIGGRFDQIARRTEVGVTDKRPEADPIFVIHGFDRADPQRLRRRIVARELAGRFDARAFARFSCYFDWPRPKQPQRPACRGNDSAFESPFSRTRIDDKRNTAAEALEHMLGAGRADRAAGIGGGRGERARDGSKKRLHRRMRWNANADGRQPCRDDGRDFGTVAQRHDECQRSRPMLLGQRAGSVIKLANLIG